MLELERGSVLVGYFWWEVSNPLHAMVKYVSEECLGKIGKS